MEEDIIIQIQLNQNDIEAALGRISKQMATLTSENKQMKKDVADGNMTWKEYAANLNVNNQALKDLKAQQSSLGGQLNVLTAEMTTANGSFKEQARMLADLKNQYASLSAVQRESEGGKAMLKQMQELDTQVKANDASMGNFQRNVGNYPTVIASVIPGFDKLNGVLGSMGTGIGQLATQGAAGFATLGKSALSMGKMFITPPIGVIVAILSAILMVIQKVKEAFSRNEEATVRMQKAFALLQPVITAVRTIFDALAVVISKVIETIAGAIEKVTKFAEFLGLLPKGYGDAAVAAQKLVQAQADLDTMSNKFIENEASRNLEIAKLRDMAVQKDKYSAQQRLMFMNMAISKEQENLNERKKIADKEADIIIQKYKQEVDTSKEAQKAVAEANATKLKAETEYYTSTRRLQSQMSAAQIEIDNEAKQKAEAAKQATQKAADDAKERRKNELDAIRQAQDTALALIKEGKQKETDALNYSYTRQIEDLKIKKNTEKNLTQKAKDEIDKTIKNLEEKQKQDLIALDKKYSDESIAQQIETETKKIELKLAAATKGSEQEYLLKTEQLQKQQQVEIDAQQKTITERLKLQYDGAELEKKVTEEMETWKILISAKYTAQQAEIDNQNKQKQLSIQRQVLENDFNEQLQALGNNEQAKLQLILQNEQEKNAQLLAMDATTKAAQYESEAAYQAAVIESKGKIIAAEKAVQQASQQTLQNQLSATSSFASAMGDVLTQIGGDNEQFAAFQKALALFNIAINTATAISGAIAAATPGDPYTVAIRIAAAIAAAIAGTAAALASAKGAKEPKAPKFAKGGTVFGPGSGTSDSIPINASSGESVMTALATQMFAPLLSPLNQIGGGVPIQAASAANQVLGEDILAQAFSRAVQSMPQPVVSVQEINSVQHRVNVLENFNHY